MILPGAWKSVVCLKKRNGCFSFFGSPRSLPQGTARNGCRFLARVELVENQRQLFVRRCVEQKWYKMGGDNFGVIVRHERREAVIDVEMNSSVTLVFQECIW